MQQPGRLRNRTLYTEATIILFLLLAAAVVIIFLYGNTKEEPATEEEPKTKKDPPFAINQDLGIRWVHRDEHTYIVASTGHGKSELIKTMLVSDLPRIQKREMSAVVIDSSGKLINDILDNTKVYGSELILIDVEDVEYPFNLNFLTLKQSGSLLDRQIAFNAAFEMLEFVIGSINDAPMTDKQKTLLEFTFTLYATIPNATILTILDILAVGGSQRYRRWINELNETAQNFFATQFDGAEFRKTKGEVERRLYSLLRKEYLAKMFANPSPAFSFADAMNAGSLILVNTSEAVLQPASSAMLGRLVIAQIVQAAQARYRGGGKETIIYVDEAADVFDTNTERLLAKARKANVGVVFAHQFLDQLSPRLFSAVMGNTATKFVGAVGAGDAQKLTKYMNMPVPEMIPVKGTFLVKSKYRISWRYDGYIHTMYTEATTPNIIGKWKQDGGLNLKNYLREQMRAKYAQSAPETLPQEAEFDPTIAHRRDE